MKNNKLKLITKILAIIVICLISFAGIYVQKLNKMENIVKGYTLNKELTGYREITLEVSQATKVLDSDGKEVGNTETYDDETIESSGYTKSDEKINADEVLTTDNYIRCKEIIEKRLVDFGVKDYNIGMDKQNGKIYIQIPEDYYTDTVISNIKETGTIEIKDSVDGTVYINENNLKSAQVSYNTTTSGTTVYLNINLDKEGTEILKDLSTNKYATLPEKSETTEKETSDTEKTDETAENENSENKKTDKATDAENKTTDEATDVENPKTETSEENEPSEDTESSEEETTQNEVTLTISGSKVLTTSFDEPMENGSISLSMSQASTDNSEISQSLQSTSTIATILNNGAMPISYTIGENKYVSTDISSDLINKVIIGISIVFVILLIYMIIKHKTRGLLSTISFLGFVALYLLVLRYTNVEISIESIVAIVLAVAINYLFSMKLLDTKPESEKIYNKEYLKFVAKIIPALAVSIIFCFIKWSVLVTFGMTMFWGIILILLYNRLITKHIVNF